VYGRPAVDVGGSPYVVDRVDAGVLLVKADGHSYIVSRVDGGPWRCTCADFKYRGRQRPCKHIRSLILAGME
jgi:hypothetical protein